VEVTGIDTRCNLLQYIIKYGREEFYITGLAFLILFSFPPKKKKKRRRK
jgi:hypothetical protein